MRFTHQTTMSAHTNDLEKANSIVDNYVDIFSEFQEIDKLTKEIEPLLTDCMMTGSVV